LEALNLSSEYLIHVDFSEIRVETGKLQGVSAEVKAKVNAFVDSLEETTANIEPVMKRETHDDERELWREYQQLQREKLAVLDLSHEWDYLEESVKETNPKLGVLVRDAIEELTDHIAVLAETHRAHIDIMEIYNTRKIEVLALIITAAISYLAVWEFFLRDLLTVLVFPYHLTPILNYFLVVITLLPVFVLIIWVWVKRKSYL